MPIPQTRILQVLIDEDIDPIQVNGPVLEAALTEDTLEACLTSPHSTIGISAAYTVKGRLTVLAIANATSVLVVQFQPNRPERASVLKMLEERLLCREIGELFAFDLAPLVLALFKDHGLRVNNGVDIQSGCHTGPKREPLEAIQNALRDQCDINANRVRNVFDPDNTICDRDNWLADIAQRAWISHYLSQINVMEHEFQEVKRVNTTQFTDEQLDQLAAPARDSRRLDQMKAGQASHEFASAIGNQKGVIRAEQKKFAGRMRKSDAQRVKVHVQGDRGKFTVDSIITSASGKPVELLSENFDLEGKTIIGIEHIGREDPTKAELKGAQLLLKSLQEKGGLLDNPWVQYISHGEVEWPKGFFVANAAPPELEHEDPGRYPLNTSQTLAVEHMLARTADKCVTVIQGPPGTGKTSVIAAFVKAAVRHGQRGIWLVAQSNVAVKNIAEKLSSSGFHDWRLLVSHDFQFDWHEHLYIKLSSENVIRSDAFRPARTKKLLGSAQNARFPALVPINTLVVDEASQIQVHDYLPALNDYVRTIRKICFIGDDKQLPPHGADQISGLKSIFEKSHFRKGVVFLDTQYRMPPQIGDYISDAVYDGQLQSNPLHDITADTVACHFIDVNQGREARLNPTDTSWANTAEREAVLQIAQRFETEGRAFRVITPYDSQRNALEEGMKQNGLDWHDKCFNVDSFQGNEEDYIIISVVRSLQLGFLQDVRRTNVMLTRCKKGMIICSSRAFLSRIAADTLVGRLAAHVGDVGWVNVKDLETADL